MKVPFGSFRGGIVSDTTELSRTSFGITFPENGRRIRIDFGYNCGNTCLMKTAISIPDDLFDQAQSTAKKLGIPRSQLFARAVREFISNHDATNITERINALLSQQDVSLDPDLAQLQSESIRRATNDESW